MTLDGVSWIVSYESPPKRTPSECLEVSDERVAELNAMPYPLYLSTPEWKERRRLAIQAAQNHCQRCGRYLERRHLQVHHLRYGDRGRESPDDLEALCVPCHRAAHSEATTSAT